MIDAVLPLFDMAVEHGRIGAHAQFVPYFVQSQPLVGVAFVGSDLLPDIGMEYLGRTDFVQVQPQQDALEISKKVAQPSQEMSTEVVEGPPAKKNGNGFGITKAEEKVLLRTKTSEKVIGTAGATEHLSNMMGDAPFCSGCGHVTVRSGSCYKCLNCGNSMGCS